MKAPAFWWSGGWPAAALRPLALLWRVAGAARSLVTRRYHPKVPLICVGNAVVGGAGKTPVTMALAADLVARGRRVGLLSRGYGGTLSGPVQVDPSRHRAADVGDEPLLLAALGPTVVAHDRAAGARALEALGVDAIVMDDGLQNPGIAPGLSLLVVDGGVGFGNGLIVPAGPLREPLAAALDKVAAVVVVGADRAGVEAAVAGRRPVLGARLEPTASALELSGRRVLGFAGIGRPEKFRETLVEIGAEIAGFEAFPDHHAFTPDQIMELVERAASLDAEPVTTSKDACRLPVEARAMVTAVDVSVVWRNPAAVAALLDQPLGIGGTR